MEAVCGKLCHVPTFFINPLVCESIVWATVPGYGHQLCMMLPGAMRALWIPDGHIYGLRTNSNILQLFVALELLRCAAVCCAAVCQSGWCVCFPASYFMTCQLPRCIVGV